MTHFRAATMDDVPPLAALIGRAFDARYGEAWTGSQLLGTLALPGAHADVAIADGAPAGFSLMRLAGDECELLLIAVDPPHARQSIGTQLLVRTISQARSLRALRMFLEVRSGNEPARQLYERHGFVCVGQRKNYYIGTDHLRYDANTMALDF